MHHRRPLAFVALAALVSACGTRSGEIVDNWGPPAGYAVLAGSVQRLGGAPAAGVEVDIGRCGSPVGGLLAFTTTDAAGQFHTDAQLPPVGLLPAGIADTLRLRCYVSLDRSGVTLDSVIVRFGVTRQDAPTTAVALAVP